MYITIEKTNGAYVISDASGQGHDLPEVSATAKDGKLVVTFPGGTIYLERRGDKLAGRIGDQAFELTKQWGRQPQDLSP